MNAREHDDDNAKVPADSANAPAGAGRQDDGWDEWDDEDWQKPASGGGTDTKLIAVIVVAAVAIIAVLLFTRRDGEDKTQAGPDEPTTEETVDEGNRDWPWAIGGQGKDLDADGLHIWSDLEGIHLRAKNDAPITVVFTADDPVTVKNPGGDVTASANEGETLTFEFPAGSDGTAGPDLDVSGFVSEFSVEATTADGPLPTEQFHVGDSATAEDNPAIFRRGE